MLLLQNLDCSLDVTVPQGQCNIDGIIISAKSVLAEPAAHASERW